MEKNNKIYFDFFQDLCSEPWKSASLYLPDKPNKEVLIAYRTQSGLHKSLGYYILLDKESPKDSPAIFTRIYDVALGTTSSESTMRFQEPYKSALGFYIRNDKDLDKRFKTYSDKKTGKSYWIIWVIYRNDDVYIFNNSQHVENTFREEDIEVTKEAMEKNYFYNRNSKDEDRSCMSAPDFWTPIPDVFNI